MQVAATKRKVFNNQRRLIFLQANYRCRYCRRSISTEVPSDHPRKATIDHKMPLSRGGSNDVDNLVASCAACNHEKSDMCDGEYTWFKQMERRGYSRDELFKAVRDVRNEQLAGSADRAA
jgi:5-methylcytosine-specific restriction endonuclease McrA